MSSSSLPAPRKSSTLAPGKATRDAPYRLAFTPEWSAETPFIRVGRIPGTPIVVIQRTSLAKGDAQFSAVFGPAEAALHGLDRSCHVLLIDARFSPGRNDADFERAFEPYRQRMQSGFRRVAVVVLTAPGRLQVERYAREDGTKTVAFDDYSAALRWLNEPAPT